MGCSNSKNNIHENSKNIPGDISSENSKISSVTSSNDRNSSNSLKYQLNTPAPSPSTIDYHNSNNNSHNNNSNLNQINLQNQPSNSIGNLNNAKRPSLLSLSNDSSLNDITVNIPDPFRSNYKVTDSLYHKNFRKLYRGIDKNRREVLVEFTEIRPYESAGHTQVDFFNRIDILRQLDHISIPKVLDVFDGSEVNRVVFDYFPGKDLDCLLKMKGSLPPHAIKPFMLALVSVAQYLHNLNILHRNLSPSSIILAAFSSFVSIQQMRVTGFTRPARMLDNFHYDISTEDQHEKEEKDILGGISIVKEYDMDVFSAPELATSHQGPAVDLYSIGGILYNITTGSAPPPLGKLDQSLSFSGDVWKREEIVNWKIQDLVTRLLLPNPQERPSLDDIIRSFN